MDFTRSRITTRRPLGLDLGQLLAVVWLILLVLLFGLVLTAALTWTLHLLLV